ncbi:MAG: hypothetical protein KME16_17210 [Scytolyngbya sp. HA4215-MV1]|jgi:hypothetical protein|nr:hypothetical protein [Scytolyngbya sp. HA4215-MV1]
MPNFPHPLLFPSLLTLLSTLAMLALPAQAKEIGGTDVIKFSEDTTIEFEFKESHGANQSTFGIINLDTNETVELFREVKPYDQFGSGQPQSSSPRQDDTGTPLDYLGTVAGGTVQNRLGESNALTEYTFRANTRYAFYLESVSPTGMTRRVRQAGLNLRAAIEGSLNAGQQGEITGTRISLDDDGLARPGKDDDFDDFVIEAGGYLITKLCPPISSTSSGTESAVSPKEGSVPAARE